jgi:hypothetical protein
MDAAVLHALGKPPRSELFPEPIAGDDEVIVHVHAASRRSSLEETETIDRKSACGRQALLGRCANFICG